MCAKFETNRIIFRGRSTANKFGIFPLNKLTPYIGILDMAAMVLIANHNLGTQYIFVTHFI